MTVRGPSAALLSFIADHINVGLLVIDREQRIVLWNRYLESHSGRSQEQLVGQDLFASFPELDRPWLEQKLRSVAILKNFAFTSWQQRPYLFKFRHHRVVVGGAEHMCQDCTFLPIPDQAGVTEFICIVIVDTTETSIYQAKLTEALATIADQSVRDVLTGIYNRRKLEAALVEEFKRARRYLSLTSLLMFDIDHFKNINDTYGHSAGDEVIRQVAATAYANLRDTDILGRYGGEEFVAILPGVSIDGAVATAERIRCAIADHVISFQDQKIAVKVSIGASEFRPFLANADAWLQEADVALYASKRGGRNRVTAFVAADSGANGDTPIREVSRASLRVRAPR